MDERKTADLRKLVDAYNTADEKRSRLFNRGYDMGQAFAAEPKVIAARDQRDRTRQEAEVAYKATAGEAETRLQAIEQEAAQAQRAVLDKHADEIAKLRAIRTAASKVRLDANYVADSKARDAENAVRLERSSEYENARLATRRALIDIALAVLGGPALLPTKLSYGAKRWFAVPLDPTSKLGPRFEYRLRNARPSVIPDDKPSATISLIVPLPDGFDSSMRAVNLTAPLGPVGASVGLAEGETFAEAIRKAEDAGILEGWLARGAREHEHEHE